MARWLPLFAFVLALVSPASAQTPFALKTVAENLEVPVFVTAPAGDPRLFIVEKTGRIRILEHGKLADTPFLDLSDKISTGNEQGLLGLAFHPNYASNGRFYVNYTDTNGDTRIVSYAASVADPNIVEPTSVKELLAIDQPYRNHNGGWIAFGPNGLLYIGMGDGGSGGDPHGNGQNPDALLGKILTLDVDNDGAPQVFASGVRNPWRNAFDGRDLYVADVGQNQWEEVTVISSTEPGANLGWNIVEGVDCYQGPGCDASALTGPILAYSHDLGCSITGGYVYRGNAIDALVGRYLYADYCAGILRSTVYADGKSAHSKVYDELGSIGNVTSFGEDGNRELYVMTADGKLMQFVPAP